jgi:hypothetical protein
MSQTFAQVIREHAANTPHAPALTFEGITWSFAQLHAVGLEGDIIDACRAIRGYPEQQIVLALVICVLGAKWPGLPGNAVAAIPAALLGGMKILSR